MIRAFVGIAVPPEVTSVLEGAQVGLRVGRLVAPENMHVTLAFLGERPGPVLEDLHHALDRVGGTRPEIRTTGLGMFGGGRPRTLFAEVAPCEALTHLRKSVRRAARDAGVPLASERFHPHITLARFGSGLVGEDAVAAEGFAARNSPRAVASFQAQSFCLFRSYLGRSGAIYEPLAEYPIPASGDIEGLRA